ncbi:MAG: heavy metal translocating P-type ATPase [Lachnospiraceae bacterium]|nr:heavy metal translocating P-type ATPase [Lachnospiraceae bacterium]
MKKKNQILISLTLLIFAIILSVVSADIHELYSVNENLLKYITYALFLISYIIAGYDVIKEAVAGIAGRDIFNENFLMTVASLGAFIIGEHAEAIAVMCLYQIGEYFQSYAVNKSRRSIASLMDIRPDEAFIVQNDGNIVKVHPKEVKIGTIIVVKPGNKIPLDGKVAKGSAMIDTAALTGESLPRQANEGDEVLSGSICMDSTLYIETQKEFGESTVSKILAIVEDASNYKSKSEKFITKFARFYTPIVCGAALLIAILPPLFIDKGNFAEWIYRALNFLVISCPCALVISVPLSYFAGLGCASSKGILIKGSNYLELLSSCDTFVFDKTGTLTKGQFTVTEICAEGEYSDIELLRASTIAEINSNHPIAISLKEAYKNYSEEAFEDYESINSASMDIFIQEVSGKGIVANYKDDIYLVGNDKLIADNAIDFIEAPNVLGTIVYVAINGQYAGYIVIADEIKSSSKSAINSLKKIGINNIYMLTGDKKEIADHVASKIGIKNVYSELLPTDKANYVKKITKRDTTNVLAFVGDGINDAPVLAMSDIGIAMGALGSDAAIEAADVVLMNDNPKDILTAIKIAKKTKNIVIQNITFSLIIKFAVMILAGFGFTNMWYAVFADVGVCIIAIINAMRTSRIK